MSTIPDNDDDYRHMIIDDWQSTTNSMLQLFEMGKSVSSRQRMSSLEMLSKSKEVFEFQLTFVSPGPLDLKWTTPLLLESLNHNRDRLR